MTYRTSQRLRFADLPLMTQDDPDRPLAISYLRFSTPEQERGDSFRRQTKAAEDYAAKHGLLLTDDLRFEDKGVSAFRGNNAASGELSQLRRMVEDGEIPRGTYLLVENLDRLSRDTPYRANRQLGTLIDAGLVVVTLSDGNVYSEEVMNSEEGLYKMFASLMVMMRANEESRTKSRRLAAANAAKRDRAAADLKRLTKRGPAWLTARDDTDMAGPEGWIVDEDKAAVIRRIFEMGRDRVGMETVAARLNQEGVPPFGRGMRWHGSYVQKLWHNPAVIGTIIPHALEVDNQGKKRRVPQEAIPGYYPAIIGEALWADVQTRKDVAKPRGSSTKQPVKNPLAGIGKCGYCGSTVTRVQKGERSKPKLVCTKAKHGSCEGGYQSVNVADVETALREQGHAVVATAPLGEGTEALEAALEGTEASFDAKSETLFQLIEELAKEPSPAKRQAVRAAEGELEALKADIEQLEADIIQNAPTTVKARMAALERTLCPEEGEDPATPEELSQALQRTCERVVIDWTSGSLLLDWRQGGQSRIVWGWKS